MANELMTANTLNALKGWPQMHAVDYHTTFAETVTDRVPPGSCVHLNSAGEYELGVGTLAVMPLFTFAWSDDYDVSPHRGPDPATQKGAWVGVNPTGQAMALVAVGAYELVSTNFVDGVFNPNDHLTSPTSGGNAGKLTVGTLGTDCICGVVSRGITDNGYGYDAVAFWPVYIPPQ